MKPQEIRALEQFVKEMKNRRAPDGGWPLRIVDASGQSNTRGACSHCKRPDTAHQTLASIDCKMALCAECVILPEFSKSLQLAA